MDKQLLSNVDKAFFNPNVPVLRPSEFAKLVGIQPATVTRLMDRGEIPYVTLSPKGYGKRPTRYINLVALFQICEKEAESWVH